MLLSSFHDVWYAIETMERSEKRQDACPTVSSLSAVGRSLMCMPTKQQSFEASSNLE